MNTTKTKVGVIGCGNIAGAYLGMAGTFPVVEVTACADLDVDRAKARAEEFQIPKACTVEDLLSDPEIEIVVNLTVPQAHAPVARQTLEAGKSAYSEKPLGVDREEGRQLLEAASKLGLRVGCAPDTFMGGGFQTCRKLIDDGWIGEPIGAAAFMTGHGPEGWHPNAAVFYQAGAGPMYDMGPYYLTALVSLLGPINRITGSARITFPERIITIPGRKGEIIKVTAPTHVTGTLEFASGAIGTIIMSFDVWASELPRIEIYGSEGTLSCPDPNGFGGPVRVRRAGESAWTTMPLIRPDAHRGIGVADLAEAIRLGRAHRASGEMALHVLDLMHSFHQVSERGGQVDLTTTCTRPKPLPASLEPSCVDA